MSCEDCKFKKEQEKIIKALNKLGYVEMTNGVIDAEIVLKGRNVWEGNRYLKKKEV